MKTILADALLVIFLAAGASAAEQSHPVIPSEGTWAGSVVIIIVGLFLAAAVIGPVVRANTPEEIPPAHSHDESPGRSSHHGASGTHDTGHAHPRGH